MKIRTMDRPPPPLISARMISIPNEAATCSARVVMLASRDSRWFESGGIRHPKIKKWANRPLLSKLAPGSIREPGRKIKGQGPLPHPLRANRRREYQLFVMARPLSARRASLMHPYHNSNSTSRGMRAALLSELGSAAGETYREFQLTEGISWWHRGRENPNPETVLSNSSWAAQRAHVHGSDNQ